MVKGLCAALAAIIIIAIIIIAIDSNRFVIRRYLLETDLIKKDVKFVFISDLHNKSYGEENKKLLEAIDACKPDFILCGGDIPTAKPGVSMQVAIHFIKELAKKYRIFYANGNHEYRMRIYPEKYGDMHENYEKALKEAGIERLINQSDSWQDDIVIHGLEIDKKYYKRFRKECPTALEIQKLVPIKADTDKKYHILLAHNPDYFKVYAKTGANLILSGHVHGGVARLPLLGGVISPSLRLFPKYDGGMYQEGNVTMILSRGLGMHTIPFRFLNPAELVEITLKAKE